MPKDGFNGEMVIEKGQNFNVQNIFPKVATRPILPVPEPEPENLVAPIDQILKTPSVDEYNLTLMENTNQVIYLLQNFS